MRTSPKHPDPRFSALSQFECFDAKVSETNGSYQTFKFVYLAFSYPAFIYLAFIYLVSFQLNAKSVRAIVFSSR